MYVHEAAERQQDADEHKARDPNNPAASQLTC